MNTPTPFIEKRMVQTTVLQPLLFMELAPKLLCLLSSWDRYSIEVTEWKEDEATSPCSTKATQCEFSNFGNGYQRVIDGPKIERTFLKSRFGWALEVNVRSAVEEQNSWYSYLLYQIHIQHADKHRTMIDEGRQRMFFPLHVFYFSIKAKRIHCWLEIFDCWSKSFPLPRKRLFASMYEVMAPRWTPSSALSGSWEHLLNERCVLLCHANLPSFSIVGLLETLNTSLRFPYYLSTIRID